MADTPAWQLYPPHGWQQEIAELQTRLETLARRYIQEWHADRESLLESAAMRFENIVQETEGETQQLRQQQRTRY